MAKTIHVCVQLDELHEDVRSLIASDDATEFSEGRLRAMSCDLPTALGCSGDCVIHDVEDLADLEIERYIDGGQLRGVTLVFYNYTEEQLLNVVSDYAFVVKHYEAPIDGDDFFSWLSGAHPHIFDNFPTMKIHAGGRDHTLIAGAY